MRRMLLCNIEISIRAACRLLTGMMEASLMILVSGLQDGRNVWFFFFQAEDGIRDVERSRGLGDVYKRQDYPGIYTH